MGIIRFLIGAKLKPLFIIKKLTLINNDRYRTKIFEAFGDISSDLALLI